MARYRPDERYGLHESFDRQRAEDKERAATAEQAQESERPHSNTCLICHRVLPCNCKAGQAHTEWLETEGRDL